MKSSLLGAAALLAGLTAAQESMLEVFHMWIISENHPLGSEPVSLEHVYFFLRSWNTNWGTICEARDAPTFPTERQKCEDPNYSFIIREPQEGSSFEYGIEVHYENPETGEHLVGSTNENFHCIRYPQFENKYNCVLIETGLPLYLE